MISLALGSTSRSVSAVARGAVRCCIGIARYTGLSTGLGHEDHDPPQRFGLPSQSSSSWVTVALGRSTKRPVRGDGGR
jgi:hypothetical protein